MRKAKTGLRGLAALSPERRREIASMGGKSIDPERRAFARDRGLAAEAGRKGGLKAGKKGRHEHSTQFTSPKLD
jgi:uncharacterized protein